MYELFGVAFCLNPFRNYITEAIVAKVFPTIKEYKMEKYIRTFAGRKVNVNDYTTRYVENPDPSLTKFNNLTFMEFGWEYIGNIDPYDESTWPPELKNEGVRAEQSSGAGKDDLAYDFRVDGWSTDYFPPIKKTNGEWEDGRTRILAARLNKEDYIPRALFNSNTDTPVSDSTANGLIANNHKKASPSAMEDFIEGGVKVVESKEVKRDSDLIMKWLTDKAKVEQRFSNDSGIWTKIVNSVLERTSRDKELVVIKDGDTWRRDFVSKMSQYKNNPQSALLLMANTGTAAIKYWTDHVLPNAGVPRPLILYTKSYSPAKCAKDVEFFIQKVTELHSQSFGYVNDMVSSNTEMFTLRVPKELPFKILGVIPNLKKDDQPTMLSNHQLVSVDDYIMQGSNISKTLKIVS